MALAAAAMADPTFTELNTRLSGLKDTSNIWWSFTQYGSQMQAGGSPMFINSMNLVGGSNYSNDLGLNVASEFGYYDYTTSTSGTYTLGTEIAGDADWNICRMLFRDGDVTASVDEGIYDFSLEIYGGDSNSANNLLGTLEYELEVFDRIDITASGSASPGVITAGQQTTVDMTVANNMASRDYVTTSWFTVNNGMEQGSNSLIWLGFTGDWFDKSISAGGSRTDAHTIWAAGDSTALGTYTGNMGVLGGLYNGDTHWSLMSPAPTVEVVAVPEPGTLAAVGLGALILLRRRRR